MAIRKIAIPSINNRLPSSITGSTATWWAISTNAPNPAVQSAMAKMDGEFSFVLVILEFRIEVITNAIAPIGWTRISGARSSAVNCKIRAKPEIVSPVTHLGCFSKSKSCLKLTCDRPESAAFFWMPTASFCIWAPMPNATAEISASPIAMIFKTSPTLLKVSISLVRSAGNAL